MDVAVKQLTHLLKQGHITLETYTESLSALKDGASKRPTLAPAKAVAHPGPAKAAAHLGPALVVRQGV